MLASRCDGVDDGVCLVGSFHAGARVRTRKVLLSARVAIKDTNIY